MTVAVGPGGGDEVPANPDSSPPCKSPLEVKDHNVVAEYRFLGQVLSSEASPAVPQRRPPWGSMVAKTLATLGDRGSFGVRIQGRFVLIESKEAIVRNRALATKTGKTGGKGGKTGEKGGHGGKKGGEMGGKWGKIV